MTWKIEYTEKAVRELLKIDRQSARKIKKYLDERIASAEDPRVFGKGLSSNLAGLWRYRVGDYRILTEIKQDKLIILVIKIGHRSKVYD
ncbi:MAG: type II toxin-antitoxin system mRNA interferase toxin, RelE/StbE family [Gammaproteobacteria bacterium]|nr:MAG: type II toxin-antitoxin system mRNA interferase toxin, RelE/StbE family [Gammaproteobacteria bacterium]